MSLLADLEELQRCLEGSADSDTEDVKHHHVSDVSLADASPSNKADKHGSETNGLLSVSGYPSLAEVMMDVDKELSCKTFDVEDSVPCSMIDKFSLDHDTAIEQEPRILLQDTDLTAENSKSGDDEKPASKDEEQKSGEDVPSGVQNKPVAEEQDKPEPAKQHESDPTKQDKHEPAKQDELEPVEQDKHEPAKQDESDPAKQDEPESAKQDEPEPAKQDEPEPTKQDEPESTKQDEPEPTEQSEPESAKQDESDPTKQDESEPTKQKKSEPAKQEKSEPTKQEKSEPTKQEKSEPTIQEKSEPTIQEKSEPTKQEKSEATKEDEPESTKQDTQTNDLEKQEADSVKQDNDSDKQGEIDLGKKEDPKKDLKKQGTSEAKGKPEFDAEKAEKIEKSEEKKLEVKPAVAKEEKLKVRVNNWQSPVFLKPGVVKTPSPTAQANKPKSLPGLQRVVVGPRKPSLGLGQSDISKLLQSSKTVKLGNKGCKFEEVKISNGRPVIRISQPSSSQSPPSPGHQVLPAILRKAPEVKAVHLPLHVQKKLTSPIVTGKVSEMPPRPMPSLPKHSMFRPILPKPEAKKRKPTDSESPVPAKHSRTDQPPQSTTALVLVSDTNRQSPKSMFLKRVDGVPLIRKRESPSKTGRFVGPASKRPKTFVEEAEGVNPNVPTKMSISPSMEVTISPHGIEENVQDVGKEAESCVPLLTKGPRKEMMDARVVVKKLNIPIPEYLLYTLRTSSGTDSTKPQLLQKTLEVVSQDLEATLSPPSPEKKKPGKPKILGPIKKNILLKRTVLPQKPLVQKPQKTAAKQKVVKQDVKKITKSKPSATVKPRVVLPQKGSTLAYKKLQQQQQSRREKITLKAKQGRPPSSLKPKKQPLHSAESRKKTMQLRPSAPSIVARIRAKKRVATTQKVVSTKIKAKTMVTRHNKPAPSVLSRSARLVARQRATKPEVKRKPEVKKPEAKKKPAATKSTTAVVKGKSEAKTKKIDLPKSPATKPATKDAKATKEKKIVPTKKKQVGNIVKKGADVVLPDNGENAGEDEWIVEVLLDEAELDLMAVSRVSSSDNRPSVVECDSSTDGKRDRVSAKNIKSKAKSKPPATVPVRNEQISNETKMTEMRKAISDLERIADRSMLRLKAEERQVAYLAAKLSQYETDKHHSMLGKVIADASQNPDAAFILDLLLSYCPSEESGNTG